MILYFSGTGNSGYAARRIADGLGKPLLCLNDRIRACLLYTSLPAAWPRPAVQPLYASVIPSCSSRFRSAIFPR